MLGGQDMTHLKAGQPQGTSAKCACARSLHTAHDEEKAMEIELAWVSDESGREFKLVPKDLVTEADAAAKAAMADSDMYATSIRFMALCPCMLDY